MKPLFSITRKEINSYFSSPLALIFVAVFLAAMLVTFFWVDEFFARNIADVRPLFHWMPTLMIFLVAALTMRQWSEEQQNGTLEILFTMPLRVIDLVIGKFLAVLALVCVALALTLFLPITIGFIGNPDVGPIIGGYLAAILMASAYIAIGLFISSRTSNQLVALILTVVVCGIFQMVGNPLVTDNLTASQAEILRAFGTGSRFESIERGVIDLRDLLYYVSITVIFLGLNIWSLDSKRWGKGKSTEAYRLNWQSGVSLLAANLVLLNVILFPFSRARLDLTQDQEYSLSPVTRDLLDNLQEPLLIRGYFSEKNHPYLAPLVPRVEDLLEEYSIAGGDMVEVETLDPVQDPEKEAEANQTYGIRPSPLQFSDRTGASVVNVYFDILIRYGDQTAVLNYQDLIEVDQFGDGQLNVRLRNLEYDLTSNIKRLVLGFQSVDAVLAALPEPAQLTLFYTPATLPSSLQEAPALIEQVAAEISGIANGKFSYQAIDVDDPNAGVDKQALFDQYNIRPLAEDFFAEQTYYLHMILTGGGKSVVIYPPSEVSEAEIKESVESALQRISSGFLKVVGVWTPPAIPQQDPFGQASQPLQQYQQLNATLRQDYEVQTVDLSQGQVPTDVDVLLLIAPENMTDQERYAVDQYLMRGGTIFVAAGNYEIAQDPFTGGVTLQPIQAGMQEMLLHYGVTVGTQLVMDTQNDPFPTPVQRNVNGFAVQEIVTLDYPYFVDVRGDGMDKENPILRNLPAVSLNWVSPLIVDDTKTANATITTLLESTNESWLRTNTDLQPNLEIYPDLGFPIEGDQDPHALAVVIQGTFTSYFKDKPLPFTAPDPAAGLDPFAAQQPTPAPQPIPVASLEESPDSARLVVVGSSEFLNDAILSLSASFGGDAYLNNLQLVQNVVDWATEDTDLLTIRSRGASARLLDPLTDDEKDQWQFINYGLALFSVVVIGGLWQLRKRSEPPMELVGLPSEGDDNESDE